MGKTLGDQAKTFRLAKGWNTAEMAEALKTSRQNVEALEKHGNRLPKYLPKLAKLLDASVDAMFYEAGLSDKPPAPAWPFDPELYWRFMALTEKQRGIVEGVLTAEIKRLEEVATETPQPTPPAGTNLFDLAKPARGLAKKKKAARKRI